MTVEKFKQGDYITYFGSFNYDHVKHGKTYILESYMRGEDSIYLIGIQGVYSASDFKRAEVDLADIHKGDTVTLVDGSIKLSGVVKSVSVSRKTVALESDLGGAREFNLGGTWRLVDYVPGKDRGLEKRYEVKRLNDPAKKHKDCKYFVLDPQHDKYALPALKGYAQSVLFEYPTLGREILEWIRNISQDVVETDNGRAHGGLL